MRVRWKKIHYIRYFSERYPLVEKLIKHLLCIPATLVSSECLINTHLRNRLAPRNLELLVFLKDNMFKIN